MALQFPGGRSEVMRRDTLQFTSDYNDFLLGTSWKKLYYGYLVNTITEEAILWPAAFTSESLNTTSADISETDFTKKLELDFDILIPAERVVEGKGQVHVYFAMVEGGTTADPSGYVIAKLIKVDGVDEEIMGTSQTPTLQETASGTEAHSITLAMDITKTSFKSGNLLRLRLEGWAKVDVDDGVNTIRIDHEGTGFWIDLPFARLDEY